MTSIPRHLIATSATIGLALAYAAPVASAGEPPNAQWLVADLGGAPRDPADYDAGYAKTGPFDSATTRSLVVPEFDCAGITQDVVLIGHATPERDGVAGVLNSCFLGLTVMTAQVGEAGSEFVPVTAGDVLRITTTLDDATMTMTVENTTTGEAVTATGQVTGDTYIIGAITDPGLQMADFGKVRLKKSKIDGTLINKQGLTKYDMVTDGDLRVKTGRIKKGSFTVTHVAP